MIKNTTPSLLINQSYFTYSLGISIKFKVPTGLFNLISKFQNGKHEWIAKFLSTPAVVEMDAVLW